MNELKPCWKCGREAIRVGKNGLVYDIYGNEQKCDFVSCVFSCMPYSEKYTVDEWQNHPRPEPSAMSELGKWIDEEKASLEYRQALDKLSESMSQLFKPEPKKLTWLQKIRGYDKLADDLDLHKKIRASQGERIKDLRARCNSAEGMRDHYKEERTSWESLAISKSRELELMTKVADNWQQRLICVQKDYADATYPIGRRLKFSVGHNHITITIGNPVTLCENFISNNGKLEWSISRCSRKDVYDWKQGVIYAVDNYCDEHKSAEKLRRDLRKALAKKYPEIFEVTK